MTHVRVVKPKKKRRVQIARDSPFPVPIATVTGQEASAGNWFYYTGELYGNHVVVKHSGDMDFLYKMGFFGKGTLSRSRPEFVSRARNADVPSGSGETTHARVLNRRSYVRHLNWSKRFPDDKHYLEYDSSEEIFKNGDVYEEDYDVPQGHITTNDPTPHDDIGGTENNFSPTRMEEDDNISDEEIFKKQFLDKTEQSTGQTEDTWAETDEDFWGCGSTKSPGTDWGLDNDKKADDVGNTSVDNVCKISTDTEAVQESQTASSCSQNRQKDVCKTNNVEQSCAANRCSRSGEITLSDTYQSENKERINLSPNNKTDLSQTYSSGNNLKHSLTDENSEAIKSSQDEKTVISEQETVDAVPSNQHKSPGSPGKQPDSRSLVQQVCNQSHQEAVTLENHGVKRRDSLCDSDEEEGDVLVIQDSDNDMYTQSEGCSSWIPVLKKDPFTVNEYLYLSLEEAFFLSFGLGCLIVRNKGKEMDLCSMWREFCSVQQSFIPKYVVYHYFRSKGWVPKSGLKFGTDFILYKIGPPFYHGSYSVIVRPVDEDTLRDDPSFPIRTFSWVSLAGLNRATEHVAKELMFCFVIKPSDLTSADCQSPSCISKFKVKEVVVSRWVSSQERQKSAEDMP